MARGKVITTSSGTSAGLRGPASEGRGSLVGHCVGGGVWRRRPRDTTSRASIAVVDVHEVGVDGGSQKTKIGGDNRDVVG